MSAITDDWEIWGVSDSVLGRRLWRYVCTETEAGRTGSVGQALMRCARRIEIVCWCMLVECWTQVMIAVQLSEVMRMDTYW